MNKTIYLNEPLEQLAEKTKGDSPRSGRFSSRLGEIVERYDIIMELTKLPALSESEINIMEEVICGSVIDRRKIRGLHLDVLDAATGTSDSRQKMSEKVSEMSPTERIKMIEFILGAL